MRKRIEKVAETVEAKRQYDILSPEAKAELTASNKRNNALKRNQTRERKEVELQHAQDILDQPA